MVSVPFARNEVLDVMPTSDDRDMHDGEPLPAVDAGNVDDFFAATYRELRRLARARLRGGGRDAMLDTTALVHESYLKLSRSQAALRFPDRARFLVAYTGSARARPACNEHNAASRPAMRKTFMAATPQVLFCG